MLWANLLLVNFFLWSHRYSSSLSSSGSGWVSSIYSSLSISSEIFFVCNSKSYSPSAFSTQSKVSVTASTYDIRWYFLSGICTVCLVKLKRVFSNWSDKLSVCFICYTFTKK